MSRSTVLSEFTTRLLSLIISPISNVVCTKGTAYSLFHVVDCFLQDVKYNDKANRK